MIRKLEDRRQNVKKVIGDPGLINPAFFLGGIYTL
jgi:hypothetical protein